MERENLGFVIVGHVDHGKSTLIGRLLYDTKSLSKEKIEEVERMSRELGRELEFAFVMDHLKEERDEGITIDTAQTFFHTGKRNYVIIDAPGHKEFIKNMSTGASQAQAALLIIDAEEGVREQTRRHAYLLAMLGLRQLTLLINKMDRVSFARERFDEVTSEITGFLDALGIKPMHVVPISAKEGDNVAIASGRMPWYGGVTVLEALDDFACPAEPADKPMRFPIQDVYEVGGRKVLVGRVESGTIRTGGEIVFLPGGSESVVRTIEKFQSAPVEQARVGESIGITIEEPLSIERGRVACDTASQPTVTDTIRADVFWMSAAPLRKGEQLRLKLATQEVSARVVEIARRIDSASLEVIAEDCDELGNNEIAELTVGTEEPVVTEGFHEVPELGRFVLVRGHDVVAGGIIPA